MLGSGDEKIGWTAARDVGDASVRLVSVLKWEPHTYVCGENGTWNQAIAKLERFYGEDIFSITPEERTSFMIVGKRFKNPSGGEEAGF